MCSIQELVFASICCMITAHLFHGYLGRHYSLYFYSRESIIFI
jgi:hypothetical protein